jgi:glycosyltransferase involved in cell wall biosynthesis
MSRVSIVTISFNQVQYLERAIRSVIDQDYSDVEYIIVDPGSTDGSREVIEKYRSRISKVILDPDSGPAQGLNHGFAAATGDIFGFINADDALLPGALTKAVAALRHRPDVDVVYAHCYIVDQNGRIVRRSRSVPFNLRLYAYGGVVIMQQSTFFRRSAFENVGGFNEKNRTCWDAELLADMALRGSLLVMVDDYWSLYAIYPGSITASVKYNRQYQADRARLFEVITGREYSRTNKLLFRLARVEKWLRNPAMLLHRVIDKTGTGPTLSALAPLS